MDWLNSMNKIFKLYKLSKDKRSLILKSFYLIILIHVIIRLFSFSRAYQYSKRIEKPDPNDTKSIQDIVWSVNTSSDLIPGSSCLIRAIVGQILLSKYHHPSKLKIGVNKEENFEAHAWLEIENNIILGKIDKEYTTILNL